VSINGAFTVYKILSILSIS